MKYRRLKNCYFYSHFGGANSILMSKNLCVISSASRTHEPCVPTGQVISRMLMRRHNMTSLRSLYVPHGSLLPTTYYPQGAAPKVACHWAMDFIPFREVSPMSISFRMALLTTNYSLLTDIAPHGISVNWLARPSVRAYSWLKKNTSRYAPIRGDFSVDSVDSVWKNYLTQTPQNNADALRNFAPLREKYYTRKAQKYTEFWSVSFCESLRRLRETIPPRMVHYYLLPTTYYIVIPRMDSSLLSPHYFLTTSSLIQLTPN